MAGFQVIISGLLWVIGDNVAAADDLLRPDRADYFDCNHLNEQGNAVAADLFFDAITASLD